MDAFDQDHIIAPDPFWNGIAARKGILRTGCNDIDIGRFPGDRPVSFHQ